MTDKVAPRWFLAKPLAALLESLKDVGDPGCTFDSIVAYRATEELAAAILGEGT